MTNAFTIPKSSPIAAELEKQARVSRRTTKVVNDRRKRGDEPNRLYGISDKADQNIERLGDVRKLVVKLKRS